MILKRINVLSLGKISAVIYGSIGMIIGIFISFFGLFASLASLTGDTGVGPFIGLFFGVGAIIFLPLLYGLLGFVIGVVTASIYNLAARIMGGVEIELMESPRVSADANMAK